MKKMQKNNSVPIDTVDIAKVKIEGKKRSIDKKRRFCFFFKLFFQEIDQEFFKVLAKGLVTNEYEK